MTKNTITITNAHMKLLEHIALNPGLETGNGKMQSYSKRLIPGLYAAGLIRFGVAAANITRVTATIRAIEALRMWRRADPILNPSALTFEKH